MVVLDPTAKFLSGFIPERRKMSGFDIFCIAVVIIEREREENNVKEISIYAGNAAPGPRKVWLMCDLSLDFLP